jgi:uncharacterized protein YjbI with pentapeptide repeats/DNA-binding XRE family transcriptional regulator
MLDTKMIGNRITEARKNKRMSQAQLGEQLFISTQAVGKWERGESMPDILTLNRLAEIMDVDLNYFSDGQMPNVLPNPEDTVVKPEKKLNWDMSGGNWVNADFSGLKELNKKFSSSNMQRSKFIGSDLSGLLLKNNNVDGCDFSESNFSGSKIENSNLVSNIFQGSTLRDVQFSGSHLRACDFSGANLTNTVFRDVAFEKCLLVNTVWNYTSFIETHIADCLFEGSIENCHFENSVFTRVTFKDLHITNTYFKNNSLFNRKNLKGIKFINCTTDRITYEFMKSAKADLIEVTLQ